MQDVPCYLLDVECEDWESKATLFTHDRVLYDLCKDNDPTHMSSSCLLTWFRFRHCIAFRISYLIQRQPCRSVIRFTPWHRVQHIARWGEYYINPAALTWLTMGLGYTGARQKYSCVGDVPGKASTKIIKMTPPTGPGASLRRAFGGTN